MTYENRAETFILDALDLSMDEAGHVVDESGDYVPTACGKPSERIDRVGGFIHSADGRSDVLLLCDNIACIGEEADR